MGDTHERAAGRNEAFLHQQRHHAGDEVRAQRELQCGSVELQGVSEQIYGCDDGGAAEHAGDDLAVVEELGRWCGGVLWCGPGCEHLWDEVEY